MSECVLHSPGSTNGLWVDLHSDTFWNVMAWPLKLTTMLWNIFLIYNSVRWENCVYCFKRTFCVQLRSAVTGKKRRKKKKPKRRKKKKLQSYYIHVQLQAFRKENHDRWIAYRHINNHSEHCHKIASGSFSKIRCVVFRSPPLPPCVCVCVCVCVCHFRFIYFW